MTKAEVKAALALFDAEPVELVPELAAMVHIIGEGTPTAMTALQHPLVYDVPYFPGCNARLNAQLAWKQQKLKDAIKTRSWIRYIDIHERPYRWQALETIVRTHRLTGPAIAELFSYVWVDSENIWQSHAAVDYLVKKVIPHQYHLMGKEEYELFRFLPNSFTAWRGCTDHNKLGMSWTFNKERARWFSQRWLKAGEHALVRTKVFQLSDVLFYTNDKGEEEIVLKRRQ